MIRPENPYHEFDMLDPVEEGCHRAFEEGMRALWKELERLSILINSGIGYPYPVRHMVEADFQALRAKVMGDKLEGK